MQHQQPFVHPLDLPHHSLFPPVGALSFYNLASSPSTSRRPLFGTCSQSSIHTSGCCQPCSPRRIFDCRSPTTTKDPIAQALLGKDDTSLKALWTPNGQDLCISTKSNRFYIFDGRYLKQHKKYHSFSYDVNDFALSQDGSTCFTATGQGNLEYLQLPNMKLLQRHKVHVGATQVLALSPNEEYISTAGSDGNIQLWDMGIPPHTLWTDQSEDSVIRAASFSSDSKMLAYGGDGTDLKILNIDDARQAKARHPTDAKNDFFTIYKCPQKGSHLKQPPAQDYFNFEGLAWNPKAWMLAFQVDEMQMRQDEQGKYREGWFIACSISVMTKQS